MRLPNAENVVIDLRKITEYCLSNEHDEGKHKAVLFEKLLGITADNAERLAEILKRAVWENDASIGKLDGYGQRYIVDFEAAGHQAKVLLRSVWIIRSGESFPRLVTSYII